MLPIFLFFSIVIILPMATDYIMLGKICSKSAADDRYVKNEMIWEITYNSTFAPEYPFVRLFGNQGKGKYILKPSKYAIDEM